MPELDEVPAEMQEAIGHEDPNPWPWFSDRDGDTWAQTPYSHNGQAVLFPFAAGLQAATRSIVQAAYGPLVAEPHCPVCGSTVFWKDGVCGMRTVSTSHPTG